MIIKNDEIYRKKSYQNKKTKQNVKKSKFVLTKMQINVIITMHQSYSRINIIREIMSLTTDKFDDDNDIELQKQVLISKILVLDEIRRDW